MPEDVVTGSGGEPSSVLDIALDTLRANAPNQTDGIWLEELVKDVAPHIRDWNIDSCWRWTEWPEREQVLGKGTPSVDVGIDLVARRRDDRRWIAIQVKSRKLDEHGLGKAVTASEIDSFLAAASDKSIWAERWLTVNGAVSSGGHSSGKIKMSGAPIKVVNVAQAVEDQQAAMLSTDSENDECPHCDMNDKGWGDEGDVVPRQSRSCMQREAVDTAVQRLRDNEIAVEDGIPQGEARGRLILPCGVGKTRIALRIVEKLTFGGELSVVLCPSIALVAQLRREFLQHADVSMRVMAVCSDKGVAANDDKVANSNDLTIDRGLATTDHIKGCLVTTKAEEIAEWISQRRNGGADNAVSVIFGTYQSAARIAEGIKLADAADGFKVLICDEAHRTAGIRNRKLSTPAAERLRDFTLCHDREKFPAKYRVYQTATPRIYGDNALAEMTSVKKQKYVVRHMDDQKTFGVELYRRAYADAVENEWLSDYRIIAMAVGDQKAIDIANDLVREADEQAQRDAKAAAKNGKKRKHSSAKRLPSTGDYLKGMAFALAMGGAAVTPYGRRVPLRSCIGFLNTIARSKTMTRVLQSEAVREWVAEQVAKPKPEYQLEHLDASSSVAKRDEAKRCLAIAKNSKPHGVLNVGIFGEGTDSPSLSAVAFLEPRKSPIDVVQAVGRAMRRAEGKALGYIIVPVVVPLGEDAEEYLAVSDKHEGWQELGDILQALRAHDKRIEDALPEMLTIQLPSEPSSGKNLKTVVAVGRPDKKNLEYAVVTGTRKRAEKIARKAVAQDLPLLEYKNTKPFNEKTCQTPEEGPSLLIVHFKRTDGSTDTRQDVVARHKPKPGQEQGVVNVKQTRRRASEVITGKRGRDPSYTNQGDNNKDKNKANFEKYLQGVLADLSGKLGNTITMNLLEKSGLTSNKVKRDLNALAYAVEEAARYLHEEKYLPGKLDEHFGLNNLSAPKKGKPRADGATIAALLWMNAAMLHQRIHSGRWLARKGIVSLSRIKSDPKPQKRLLKSWYAITRQDFLPVIEPAILALEAAENTGRLGGLRWALRHLVAEAEHIAETYADMGTDHAGALFNKVMGDQSSDGAFFTRPPVADIAARLALEAADPDNKLDWSNPDVWREHKTVDLACGSGTLLTAVMTEMKRRATLHGADNKRLAELQKVAVEEMLKGLDINAVSLQLAATQLMSGNTEVKYRDMGLHQMPYGPQDDDSVAAGSPELFGSDLLDAGRLFTDSTQSTTIKTGNERERHDILEGPDMDDAVEAVRDARIVIMNPPFTNRIKMGEKFDKKTQQSIRARMDILEGFLADADPGLSEFLSKNSLRPLFAALADICLNREKGVFATIIPTTALTNISGFIERLELAKRFHIHTILTCHQARDVGLSQHSEIGESIVIMRRLEEPTMPHPDTRIISLDRLPTDSDKTAKLFYGLKRCNTGTLPDGWGEVSFWPAKRILAGDWTAAIWRSPALADTAARFSADAAFRSLQSVGLSGHSTGRQLSNGYARCSTVGVAGAFPILSSRGVNVQQRIKGQPDEDWEWEGTGPPPILSKAAHLFVTTGQYMSATRLTALATTKAYVGRNWRPITGATLKQAQALAVFINSTIGRLMLMGRGGQFLHYPTYNTAAVNNLPIPDINNDALVGRLVECWEDTRNEIVPQFRDGYTDIRRRWDAAVCDALGWDIAEITELGELLAQEPRIRGVANGQWKP